MCLEPLPFERFWGSQSARRLNRPQEVDALQTAPHCVVQCGGAWQCSL